MQGAFLVSGAAPVLGSEQVSRRPLLLTEHLRLVRVEAALHELPEHSAHRPVLFIGELADSELEGGRDAERQGTHGRAWGGPVPRLPGLNRLQKGSLSSLRTTRM